MRFVDEKREAIKAVRTITQEDIRQIYALAKDYYINEPQALRHS
jgi:hypothetical protein